MASGLRVTRIDRAPAAGPLPVCVNGVTVGKLLHRTSVELTVHPGELLLELSGNGNNARFLVLEISPGCTARVQVGRSLSLGLMQAGTYLQVDPQLLGLPDRTLHPLNLSARTALQWLQQKRSLGEPLSRIEAAYLQQRLGPPGQAIPTPESTVPSLAELGAFAALGLDVDAEEDNVREAFRLLMSIHACESARASETMQRLEEAFRIAMKALGKRTRQGVSEVGR